MENTLENKIKFFGQYLDQDVLIVGNALCDNKAENWIEDKLQYTQYLLLKPLSSITEDDAIKTAHIIGGDSEDGFMFISALINNVAMDGILDFKICSDEFIMTIDYIRSKGYALSYNGLSIETLISYGWIKLK